MAGRGAVLAFLLPLLGACNMAMSEAPMFTANDKAAITPMDGIWLSDDQECAFDTMRPEADWPDCAMWLVVRAAGREFWVHDGKGQSERGNYLIAGGMPPVVQIEYTDGAKEDGKTFYVFFGIEAGPADPQGRFSAAFTWEVQCGVQGKNPSDIAPHPGISPECRPSSTEALRSAAQASRPTAQMAMRWRWLRPELSRPDSSPRGTR